MKQEGLVKKHAVVQFKDLKTMCNKDKVKNVVKRKFSDHNHVKVSSYFFVI